MPKSNSAKGQYYKLKTKKWLLDKGYFVEYIEQMHRIFVGGRVIFTKRDLFASDILAISTEELIFIQVKLNRKNIAAAIKEFHKIPFPPFAQRWIIIWEKRKKEPDIEVVA